MIVAIENGLNELKQYLENSGHKIVDRNYRGAVDAYIFQNEGFNGMDNFNFTLQNSTAESGVLMINAKNKTPDEVLKVLENRIYGDILNFL